MTERVPTGVFVGLCTLDVVQLVDRVPGPNEKVQARRVSLAAGGPATNAAVAFAALGGRSVLITRLPDDPPGRLALADLESHGVEVRSAPGGGTTTVASILVTEATGERAIVSAVDQGRSGGGGESAFGVGIVSELSPDVVLVDSHEVDLSAPIARDAVARGVPVLLDCGSKKPQTGGQLPLVTAAIVSESYLPGGPPAIAAEVASYGVPFGAITAGAGPIRYWVGDPGRLGEVPVAAVPVVDTLGAGDFFHGALAYAVARDGLAPLSFPDALAFAAHIAGLSVQHFGTRSWLEDLVAQPQPISSRWSSSMPK